MAAGDRASDIRVDARAHVDPDEVGHAAGTAAYRRISAALFLAGAGTFTLLYSAQALLPAFADSFQVSPAVSSLTLSAATGTLALAIIPISAVAESWGRQRVMTLSLTVAAVLGLLAPLAPSFEVLLAIRAVQGVAMAGMPALAMAHLSREVQGRFLGQAMGLLIAGNTIGGLSGRLLGGVVTDWAGWRVALAVVGGLSFLCLVGFHLLMPPTLDPGPRAHSVGELARQVVSHLGDPGVRRVCLVSFVLMSAFVTVYNYLGFRLLEPPFGLSQALVGLIFLVYLAGTVSSTVAGALGDRVGRPQVLWVSVALALVAAVASLPDLLWLVLAALVLFTVGFFGAHSVASSWLSQRVSAAPAQASALYLFCYYAGSSVGGAAGGVPYERAGWPGVVGFVVALLLVALVCALLLRMSSPSAARVDVRN
jgi:MFS transporter, YNFM family, putative membrane transport protein